MTVRERAGHVAARIAEGDRLLSRRQTAAMLGVCPQTVTTWAKDGRLDVERTLGGMARYWESGVHKVLSGQGVKQWQSS